MKSTIAINIWALLIGLVLLPALSYADITVINNGDLGAGSLRQAIVDLPAGQTINFAAGLDGQTINLASPLIITKDMTIDATNIVLTVTLDDYVFDISAATVTLRGLNIINQAGAFAAVRCSNGTLTIDNSYVDGADRGVLFINFGLTINNSTIRGANRAIAMGGGNVTVNNSTVVGLAQQGIESGGVAVNVNNSTIVGGGGLAGIQTINGTSLYSSIVIPSVGGGGINDLGFNNIALSNAAAGIAAVLANNGGPTPTLNVLAASPVIDSGDCAAATFPNHDQRFYGLTDSGPRAVDGDLVPGAVCDIGAVEFLSIPLPVEISSFTVLKKGKDVVLKWTTVTELNNAGFEIEHLYGDEDIREWTNLAWIQGSATSFSESSYEYFMERPEPGIHKFRLKQIDFDGLFEYSAEVEIDIPFSDVIHLSGPYPNPIGSQHGASESTFTVSAPMDRDISIEIFDAMGKSIGLIFDGLLVANTTQQFSYSSSQLPSGIYFYRIAGGGFSKSYKFIVSH